MPELRNRTIHSPPVPNPQLNQRPDATNASLLPLPEGLLLACT